MMVDNGEEVVNFIMEYLFDVVLMDIEMLIYDGLEVMKCICVWDKGWGGYIFIVVMIVYGV